MADKSGPDISKPDCLIDKHDKNKNDVLLEYTTKIMEKLRRRQTVENLNWSETGNKLQKMTLVEKPQAHYEKQLDLLQTAFIAHGLRRVCERLERVASSLGLRSHSGETGSGGRRCFLEADCFNIDVTLEATGFAREVRLRHDSDQPTRCSELIKLINEGKFDEFKNHIKGIQVVYNIGNERQQKSRVFSTLTALETDLLNLAKFQDSNNVATLVLKSPLGIVVPRVAGRPMKLVYFVPPYELVDEQNRALNSITEEEIRAKRLGHSVEVTIEPSTPHKLQNIALLGSKVHDGKSLPTLMPLNKINSCILPAVFVMRLNQPLAVSKPVIAAIQAATGVDLNETQELSYKPLFELLMEKGPQPEASEDQCESKPLPTCLTVPLPDQIHRYAIQSCGATSPARSASGGSLGNTSGSGSEGGHEVAAIITRVPFVHPNAVPRVIKLLRGQALFNTVLSSCMRSHASTLGGEGTLTFELTALSMQAVSAVFEHPVTDTFITAAFDLSDTTNVRCTISAKDSSAVDAGSKTEQQASTVLQRCLSLPITLRFLARSLQERLHSQQDPTPFAKSLTPSPHPSVRFLPTRHVQTRSNLSRAGQERRAGFIEAHNTPATSATGSGLGDSSTVPNVAPALIAASRAIGAASATVTHTPTPVVTSTISATSASTTGVVLNNGHPPYGPMGGMVGSPFMPPHPARSSPAPISTPISAIMDASSSIAPPSSMSLVNNNSGGPHSHAANSTGLHSVASILTNQQQQQQAKSRMSAPTSLPLTSNKRPGLLGQNSGGLISPSEPNPLDSDALGGFVDPSKAPDEKLEAINKDKIKKNPMLAQLLDNERDSPEPNPNSQHSMLSKLLEDNGNSTPDPTGPSPPHKTNASGPGGGGTLRPNTQLGPSQQTPTSAQHNMLHAQQKLNALKQQQQQQQEQQKQQRKRKITSDSRSDSQGSLMGSGGGLMTPPHMGMSPKRMMMEHDLLNKGGVGHYPGPPPQGPNQHPGFRGPHPSHIGQHPVSHPGPMYPGMENHLTSHGYPQHNSGQPPSHPMHGGPSAPGYGGMLMQHNNLMHPGMGMHPGGGPTGTNTNNSAMLTSTVSMQMAPGVPSNNTMSAMANFHTQTRVVGGVNNALRLDSSSLHQSVTPPPQSSRSASSCATSTSLASSSHHPPNSSAPSAMLSSAGSALQEQSHVARLASSVDQFIRQESGSDAAATKLASSSFSTNSSFSNVHVNSSSSILTSMAGQHLTNPGSASSTGALYSKNSVGAGNNAAVNVSSVMTSAGSGVTSPPSMFLNPVTGFMMDSKQLTNSGSSAGSFHKQNQYMSELESLLGDDSPQMGPAKITFPTSQGNLSKDRLSSDSYPTVDDSILRTESKLGGSKSPAHNSGHINALKTKSFEAFEFNDFNDATFLGPQPSVDGAYDITHHLNAADAKPLSTSTPTPYSVGLKRNHSNNSLNKQELGSIVEQQSKNLCDHPKKERKKNRSDWSVASCDETSRDKLPTMKININTNTIVRQSPSPAGGFDSSRVSMESLQDSSRDSDCVFIAPGGAAHASPSGNSSASGVSVSTPNHNDSHHHHHHHSSSSSHHKSGSSKSKSDNASSERKKKKSSRHNSDVKHERKRKRAEEERIRAEQAKKQKVYDFDFNESEHLPAIRPTKIKIKTFDGQMQIQTTPTGGTKVAMSPLPMKTSDSRSDSTGRSSSKSHRSDKKRKHKDSSSSKSKQKGSSSEGKSDSKLVKKPVVKIKPLHNSSENSGPQPSHSTPSTPHSAPVRLNDTDDNSVKSNHVLLGDIGESKSTPSLVDTSKSVSKESINIQAGGLKVTMSGPGHGLGDSKTIVVPPNCVSDNRAAILKANGRQNSTNCVIDKNRLKNHSTSVVTVVGSDESNKSRSSMQNNSEIVKAKSSASSENAKRTSGQNSTANTSAGELSSSKSRTSSTTNSLDASAGKSRSTGDLSVAGTTSSSASVTASRAKTPTQQSSSSTAHAQTSLTSSSSSESGKHRTPSSSCVSAASATNASTTTVASDGKNRTASSVSVSEGSNSGSTKNTSGQNTKGSANSNKANSSVGKQRKGSLSRVIDKLKESLGDSDTPQSQKSNDEIRLGILAALGGPRKQGPSSLPKIKIQKLSKLDVTSSGTSTPGTNSPSVASKSPSSNPTTVPSKSSNPTTVSSKSSNPTTVSSKSSNPTTVSSKTQVNSAFNAIKRDISNKQQSSPNVLNSSNKHGFNSRIGFKPPAPKGDGKSTDVHVNKAVQQRMDKLHINRTNENRVGVSENKVSLKGDPRKANPANTVSKSANMNQSPNHSIETNKRPPSIVPQRQNARDSSTDKAKRFNIDDISKRLQSEQGRHFLDAVVPHSSGNTLDNSSKVKTVNASTGVSPKYKSAQQHTQPSPLLKTPPPQNKLPQMQNSTVSSKPANSYKVPNKDSSHSAKSQPGQPVNRPKTPSNMRVEKGKPEKHIAGAKSLLLDPRKPEVCSPQDTGSKPEAEISREESETPASPPAEVSFYNPARALKKANPTTVNVSDSGPTLNRSVPLNVPLEKVNENTSGSDLSQPVGSQQGVVIPNDTPASPIRHETPPASPMSGGSPAMGATKSIPLGEAPRRAATPIEEVTPASPDAESADECTVSDLKAEPVIIASEKVVAVAEKDVGSPHSDVSSPGLVIDDPHEPTASLARSTPPVDSTTKAIPLVKDSPKASLVVPSATNFTIVKDKEEIKTVSNAGSFPVLVESSKATKCAIDDNLMDEALGL